MENGKGSPMPEFQKPLEMVIDDVKYTIKPYQITFNMMKIVITAEIDGQKMIDRIDLYVSNAREQFSQKCSSKIGIDTASIEEDLYKIILKIEEIYQ